MITAVVTNNESDDELSTGAAVTISIVVTFIITLVVTALITYIITNLYCKYQYEKNIHSINDRQLMKGETTTSTINPNMSTGDIKMDNNPA